LAGEQKEDLIEKKRNELREENRERQIHSQFAQQTMTFNLMSLSG
jgi:hypothetical protein